MSLGTPHQVRMKRRFNLTTRPYYMTKDKRMPGYQRWRNMTKRWAPLGL